MQAVRTEHGDWRLYTSRRNQQNPESTRQSAITYTLDQKMLWLDDGPILWPTVNTPFGVFATRDSITQSHAAKFEWEIVSAPPKPSGAPGAGRVLSWAISMAKQALRERVPEYVVDALLGDVASRCAAELNMEEDKSNGMVSSGSTTV
tara:strand:+ start:552 stop:995 length:444 start_codon:yes stop_codon:yes gene_type:complete